MGDMMTLKNEVILSTIMIFRCEYMETNDVGNYSWPWQWQKSLRVRDAAVSRFSIWKTDKNEISMGIKHFTVHKSRALW